MADMILQWQLISASPRFPHVFKTVTLLFHITHVFSIGYRRAVLELILSHDFASGSDITPCNKIDKSLVVYRFTGNVMTSITTLYT